MPSDAGVLSRAKYWLSAPLGPRLYWHLMGRYKAVPAVTSEYATVEDCLASGELVAGKLQELGVINADAVTLHIGSGLGRVEYHLAPLVKRCYGADVSPSMVKQARRLVTHHNVEFVSTTGRDLSWWEDESLDLIYSFLVFQHVPRQQFQRYVRESHAKLVPGGHLVFQMMIDDEGNRPEPPASHPYGLRYYRRDEVRRVLTDAGFTDIDEMDGADWAEMQPNGHDAREADVVFGARAVGRSGIQGLSSSSTGDERYPFSERLDVLPLIPPSARSVLDVGCGRGGFGHALRRASPSLVIWGAEEDADLAAEASSHYDRMIVGPYPDVLADTDMRFDCVVFNDVLEHMVDPWAALRETLPRLMPGATVVASIPNVRNLGVLLPLVLRGVWTYSDMGVLDRTHLRFFTKRTILSLFADSGFEVNTIHGTNSIGNKRFALARFLPKLVGDLAFTGFVASARPTAT